MMLILHNENALRDLLSKAHVIAVVGHSDRPYRTSYQIAGYLRRAGYKVYPVNPEVSTIDGEVCYPSLADVPEPIDIVNVFRRSEFLADVVEQAANVHAKAVWAQLGVESSAAAKIAEANNLPLVMDACIKVEHRRLLG
jgi:predicted CoA-binding protein